MPHVQDEFIQRLEASGAGEFAALLANETDANQSALREYFGADLDSLRALSQSTRANTPADRPLGNVIVLHGILGSHLAEGGSTIWLNPWSILRGRMARLVPGTAQISPQGLLKRYYGRQLLTLARRWNVQGFAYDWRLPLDHSAASLAAAIDAWFPASESIHLVAHSMGGLVARAFLQLRPSHNGRLVMLGTPNRGSYSIPQLLHGMHGLLSPLAALDMKHSRDEFLQIIRSWPGAREMDPANPRLAALPIDPARMIYIAGNARTTAVSIRDAARLGTREGYEWSGAGDGTVPHTLGPLPGVPTYYVDEEHGALPNNALVLAAVDELLQTGDTKKLPNKPNAMPNTTRGEVPEPTPEMAGFLASSSNAKPKIKKEQTNPSPSNSPQANPVISVRCADLAHATGVDAVVVGHYEGVAPRLWDHRPTLQAMASQLPSGLGEPFYIPSPKAVPPNKAIAKISPNKANLANSQISPNKPNPPILVIGMGPVGRLREAELRTLVDRLLWAAGQFGIQTIATTLIGSGQGNLPLERAAAIWLDALQSSHLRVTFFEHDPERAAALARLLDSPAPRAQLTNTQTAQTKPLPVPIARLSIERTRTGYRVALLTREASIPEREIAVDHALIEEMNSRLADRCEDASEWAECLQRLLLPAELRQASSSPGPVVVACDRAAAQIHWEHLHPHVSRQFRSQKAPFRSTYERVRRVLLVADTCADARLAGAAEEGEALAELLRQRGLDVTALIGPREATRAAVLRELLLRRYDVMHYAGHCAYEPDDASRSGWVFTGSAMLTGREMERLDSVPALIFSNACESGRLADVPGFAEALFGLGVQNMVATARPVGDAAAKAFAMAFYGAAGGPFHEAMRAGRSAAGTEAASWQHYGNPATLLLNDGRITD